MLALGIHTGGVLGKLLSETIEAIDPGQVEGVAAVGAPRLHVIGFGVVPQILPNFLSYILLRFESDIRSASVIGMVGGGGIGFYLWDTIRAFNDREAATVILLIVAHGRLCRHHLRPYSSGRHLTRRYPCISMRLVACSVSRHALGVVGSTFAADPSWPKELIFALLSTESAPEVGRRWTPILEQLSKDLGIPVKQVAATDYRGSIEALKFNKAQIGQLGPKGYVEASNNNYANVEPIVQLQHANGSLGYRSCLIVHADSDLFSPEDIAGKTFAFNDPNSTSGYLVPMTFFLMEMGIDPKEYFSKLTFSGSHEASILAVANKKVDVASTNLPDIQQMTREGKIPRGAVRVIWVSKLIPNDPIVVRKDLPDSLKQAIQQSLTTMKAKNPEAFVAGGAWIGGFVKVDDDTYQIIRDLNETAKRLAALK